MKNIRKMFADCLFNQKTVVNNGQLYGFVNNGVSEFSFISKRKTGHKGWFFRRKAILRAKYLAFIDMIDKMVDFVNTH